MKKTLLAQITLGAALVALTYGCSSSQLDADAASSPAVALPSTEQSADEISVDEVSTGAGPAQISPPTPAPSVISNPSPAANAPAPNSPVNAPVANAPVNSPVANLPEPAVDESMVMPEEVDSPTGQIRCRAVLSANAETQDISVGLEFVYPQLRGGEYLYVQIKSPNFDDQPDFQQALFHTAGEDSNWTVPNVMGIAPVDITLFAAARGPVNDRFVASFRSYPAVPVACVPL